MKGRSPKAEVRTPKSEARSACGTRPSSTAATCERTGRPQCLFGFRVLVTAPSLLVAQQLFAAAANPAARDEIPALRPPHAELPASFWEQYGPWVILAGALLLALVGAAIWFLTRPKPPVIAPPEIEARKALVPLCQQPEDGALLSRVSQILRHYFAAVFGLPPEELTTAEFCRAMAAREQVGPELTAALSDFLHQCDQRKFSPPAPARLPPCGAVAQALRLIDQAQVRRSALAQAAAQSPPIIPSPPVAPTGLEQ